MVWLVRRDSGVVMGVGEGVRYWEGWGPRGVPWVSWGVGGPV